MPKVSVIIPIYGVEKYIERCARSLFEQTLDDIEYLFIDDCTPDKSVEILKLVLAEYPHCKTQVIIHRMKQNSGQAKVREWGIKNAKGDYIIHCDSDDWMELNALELLYNCAKQTDADIVFGDFNIVENSNTRRKGEASSNTLINDYLGGIISGKYSANLWNKIIRRSLYASYKDFIFPENSMGEDFVIVVQCAIKAKIVNSIDVVVYNYVINDQSISFLQNKQAIDKRIKQEKANTELFLDIISHNGIQKKYKREIQNRLLNCSMVVLPFIKDSEYLKIWKSFLSYYTQLEILSNRLITFRNKVIYILCFIRLYPILKRLK